MGLTPSLQVCYLVSGAAAGVWTAGDAASDSQNLADCRPHESDEGIVYEAKIGKEDIYAYLSDDNTVFLNPNKLFNILHHKNFPLDDIELSDEDTIRH